MGRSNLHLFAIVERDIGRNCREFEVVGDLDEGVATRLSQSLAGAAAGRDTLLIQLRRCESMDSDAISVLAAAQGSLEAQGTRLLVLASPPELTRLLATTELLDDGFIVDLPPLSSA